MPQPKLKVLVTDIAWPSLQPEAKVLTEIGAELVLSETGSEDELIRLAPDADAILTNLRKVPASVFLAGEKIQVISRYGIGVDNIDVPAATRLGIPVANVPEYCLDEVAEHSLAMLLALSRRICQFNQRLRLGNWDYAHIGPIFRVSGKTLGMIGFGKIARKLAEKAAALGLQSIAYDPMVQQDVFSSLHCRKVALDELLKSADFVSIHCPLTPETRGLIDETRLRLMKPAAYLINTSRGAVVDLPALVKALEQGWIAGAALDVFDPEPLPNDHPFFNLPNIITTPHMAFYSQESMVDLEVKAARNIVDIFSGKRPASIVNPEVLLLPRWSHLRE